MREYPRRMPNVRFASGFGLFSRPYGKLPHSLRVALLPLLPPFGLIRDRSRGWKIRPQMSIRPLYLSAAPWYNVASLVVHSADEKAYLPRLNALPLDMPCVSGGRMKKWYLWWYCSTRPHDCPLKDFNAVYFCDLIFSFCFYREPFL